MRRCAISPRLGFAISFILLIACSVALAQPAPPQGSPEQTGQVPPDVAGPPVARISVINGDVSVRRGDNGQTMAAAPNAPIMANDTIATGPGARAEIQFDFANRFRLGHDGQARIAQLEPQHFRVELAHGTASFSVVGDSRSFLEVSTPNVAVRGQVSGLYRVWVRDDGQTVITVRHGQAEVLSPQGTEQLQEGQTMFVRGSPQDPEFQVVQAGQPDAWDSWNEQRDQMLDRSKSNQYVNPGVYGVEDLDAYGTWSNDPSYGEVWTPRVAPDWAPYRAGRWVYEDYYGWTWVSDDPWGWAPYHYGSWYYGPMGWSWYPGPIAQPVFWRPAMVAFFGFGRAGVGIGFGFGGFASLGWVPLAPFEPFVAWYGRGWAGGGRPFGGFVGANIAGVYRNARVNGAVSGVAAGAFAAGRFGAISRVRPDEIRQAGLVRGRVPITPTAATMRLSNRPTAVAPRAASSQFVSRASVASLRQAPREAASGSAWGRFGTPNRIAPSQGANGSSGWGRFGAPNRVAPSASSPSGAAGWNRFAAPSASGAAYQGAAYQRYSRSPAASYANSYGQVRAQAPSVARQQPARGSAPVPRAASKERSAKPSGHSGGGGGHHGR